jgi:hypothetical protein
MTKERHLLRHYFIQTNEGDVVVVNNQRLYNTSTNVRGPLKSISTTAVYFPEAS